MEFEIIVIDRDYNAYVSNEYKEFASKEEAEEYCRRMTWSGYSYSVGRCREAKNG